jgi:hypothetical protein
MKPKCKDSQNKRLAENEFQPKAHGKELHYVVSLNKFQYFLEKAKEHETCMYIAQPKNVKHFFVMNCSRDQRN